MHTRSKLALAALSATLLMGLAVGSASANRLSITNPQFRVTWSSLALRGIGGLEGQVSCPVTLEGSFHSRTIVKALGTLIGYITRAISGSGGACTGGSATALTEALPWHITYEGFSGTLPRPTAIRLLLRIMAFNVEFGLGGCLYAEAGSKARGELRIEANGGVTGLVAESTIRFPLIRGGGFCPSEGTFEGTARVTLLNNTTAISIRLI